MVTSLQKFKELGIFVLSKRQVGEILYYSLYLFIIFYTPQSKFLI